MANAILRPEVVQAAIDADPRLAAIQKVAVPRPLPDIQPETDCPLTALGDVLGNAAATVADVVQLPPAIAAQSVLAAAAMAAQQIANVEIDGRVYPLSLFCLTVAESGDRKSSADKLAKKPIDDWQRELIARYREAQQQYRDEMDAHKAEREILLKKDKGGRAEVQNRLAELPSPTQPTKPFIFSQEPTLEGLQKSFVGGHPSQGLFTDEGGQFFGGHAMNKDNALKTIAGLSKFWDGAPIYRTRAADGESAALYDRRLSIHLLVQPIVANLVLSDPMLQQQGLLARFLMAYPRSIAGSRPYNYRDASLDRGIIRYQDRMAELLAKPIETDEHGGLILHTLTLDAPAKGLWVECYNEIEANLKPGQPLEVIRATGAKMADNIARIAGVLAVVEGVASITQWHMASAIQLGQFYLSEQLRLAQRSELESIAQQAQEVADWIKAKGGEATIEELQKGPRSVRKSVDHIREVMALLVEHGRCTITNYNGSNKPSAWSLTDV